jgi:hypothetical protein
MLRCIALLLSLWIPVQGFAAALLHDHGHEGATSETSHVVHAVADVHSDATHNTDEGCAKCELAHSFCQLGANPGACGSHPVIVGPIGQCFHAAVGMSVSPAPVDDFSRPPLAHG